MGEDGVLRIDLPCEMAGKVRVTVEREPEGNGAALLAAIQSLPPRNEEDRKFWQEAREELFRDRDAWDED